MSSTNENLIKEQGKVIEVLPNSQFIIERESGGEMRCYLSGKMRQNKIKILIGDKAVFVFPKNIQEPIGRIIFRK